MTAALLTALLWSISSTASSRAAAALGALRVNRLRLAISLLALTLALGLLDRPLVVGAAGWFLLSGVIGLGVGDIAMFVAFRRLGARLTVLLTQCVAVPVAWLVEWAWLGTAPTVVQGGLAVMILIGVAAALAPGSTQAVPRDGRALGIICGVLSALGLAFSGVLSRKGYTIGGDGTDAISAALLRNSGGLAVMLALWPLRPLASAAARAFGVEIAAGEAPRWALGWPWLVATALIGPCLGVVCYQWALSTSPAGAVQAVVAVTPILVMPLAWLSEGDRPTGMAIIGALLAVGGAIGMALAR